MNLFTVIDDAVAIVRLKNGVQKQTKMYSRGDRVFIPHGGGYLRITAKFGDTFGTSHPDIKVEEFEAAGVLTDRIGHPVFRAAALRAAA